MSHTFYFYDYETFGVDPARDWPAQFAGIRTDPDFKEIEEPLELFCKLPEDQLPHPEACLVTGLTPQKVNQKGICEAGFIGRIHQEFARPNTCVLGYNTLRFDDEVTRYSLYRNFFDPYAREWQNGCSRWDLIDVVRLCAALRPEGIVWPKREDGSNSFKLEELTRANGISHADAHDAVSDVRATIAMAKLCRQAQPELFNFALHHRKKAEVAKLLNINIARPRPVVHVSGMFPAIRNCLAVVAPLAPHPTNNNGVLVYDLSVDPEPLLSLTAEEIHKRIYTSNEELVAEGKERIPVKTVHINKCPIVAPLGVIKDDWERLEINRRACEQHYSQLFDDREALARVRQKLQDVFSRNDFPVSDDPDHRLYGGFFPNQDKPLIEHVRNTSPEHLSGMVLPFSDDRLEEMLFRYRARNWPELLSEEEKCHWGQFRSQRLRHGCGGDSLDLQTYHAHLEQLLGGEASESRRQVLRDLQAYGHYLEGQL
ncbi:exodeoxyribonuclease I [Sansalvadorimonas sp. 2012CJ34-2]|uniref:Exodeoxyribonuclease I n=1 Tax=Parendozoicomonas callyspongiae TaxID=2942213 RepID=A0ABT0PK06_9GAMM|nr:exodeoxyribonuclease I [Sansalvadorimonas sp. 2012CJ34-2]